MIENIVVTCGCNSYSVDVIKDIIYKGIQKIGFNITKSKVLLKPNLLSAKTPDKAVTTHPEFVRAIAEIFIDYSCDVYIGDSPGYETTKKVLLKNGLMKVVNSHGLKVKQFNDKVKKLHEGISPYREFIFGDDPDEYEHIINIPKLKSHAMMGLTLGVKNTFGFIPAFEKAKWHLKAGRDIMLFASLLIDIHNIVKPSLTIIDGIVGMDGEGPSSGRVIDFGFVGISKNAFDLDYLIEDMIGLPYKLPISELAFKNGFIRNFNTIDISSVNSNLIKNINNYFSGFLMPSTINTDWGLPKIAKKILNGLLFKKPDINYRICKKCNICITVCPSGALVESGKKPDINYDKCIRCYCCQEMCPEGAIKLI